MKSTFFGFLLFACIAHAPEQVFGANLFSPVEEEFDDILENAVSATVFIANETNYFDATFGPDPYTFFEMFRGFYEWFWQPDYAHGSGFIISPDGYIITNHHVVDSATTLLVVLQDPNYRVCKAKLIGSDARTDVAVLKIETPPGRAFPYIRLGDSNIAKVGEKVFAIGSPKTASLEASVTSGIISAKDRGNFSGLGEIEGYIQTDASINGGNSGGPLVNKKGEVIGMNTWIMSHFLGYEGLGFAVTSNTIQLISDQLIANGKVAQGFLGVELDENRETAFDIYYFNRNDGAIVLDVLKDSPAKRAGLTNGDLIVKINDFDVRSAYSLRNQIWLREPGATVRLLVDRGGQMVELTLKLGSEELSKMYASSWKFII